MPDAERPRVLVPVADGSEEIEVACIVDTLRRADIAVTLAAVGDDLAVTCSRGVRLVADTRLDDLTVLAFALALVGVFCGEERRRQVAAPMLSGG